MAGIIFFFSGASALVYQVAWQRILALQTGVGIHSVAFIVAAFMAGLGLGSWLGGRLSARIDARRALLLFSVLELATAGFGAASPTLYYDWLYLKGAALYGSPWRAGLMHFASLLLPTALMGASLPLLVRATVKEASRAGAIVGYLYGINVLGASAGALLTPWVLIRYVGIRGGLLCATLGNIVAGLGALLIRRMGGPRLETEPPEGGERGGVASPSGSFQLWVLLYSLSGFLALSLEVLWFRVVDVAEKSTAFTFGTVLSVYLLGSAVGSLLGTRLVGRVRRPLLGFLLCSCLVLIYAGLAIVLMATLPPGLPGYRAFYEQFARPGPYVAVTRHDFLLLYLALPALLFGPPTLLMGLSFPILQRAVHDEVRTSGRKVGLLQAANILGCLLGSLLVGVVLLDGLGTTGALRLVLALGLVFAAVGWRSYGGRWFGLPALVLVVLVLRLPGQRELWLRLHATDQDHALLEEDATGVVVIKRDRPEAWSFWVHGKRNSDIPYGGLHTLLGAVPALIHPGPREVAIIGLGSGDTAWASACRPLATRVTVFEIVSSQIGALRRLSVAGGVSAQLEAFLGDPRISVRTADGRNALERDLARWDIVEMDALWPPAAYSGNLYSVEFLSRCARKLRPGGIMCSWSPTPRVYASFCQAFPHVVALGQGRILVGSNEALALDVPAWLERLSAPAVQSYLGARLAEGVKDYLKTARAAAPAEGVRLNHDLFPRDEFDSPE